MLEPTTREVGARSSAPASIRRVRRSRAVLRLFWATDRLLDRITGGRFDWGDSLGPSVWLTTIGRTTGIRRENPLTYLVDGPNLIVVASNGGDASDPAWWLNLQARPDTDIRLPRQSRRPIHAREALDPERSQLWARFVAAYPRYEDYRRQTARRLPVVVLEPRQVTERKPEPAPTTEPAA
jgi:F420H(2)-dependent quinone reductase